MRYSAEALNGQQVKGKVMTKLLHVPDAVAE